MKRTLVFRLGSYVGLILLLTAGAAQSLAGSNTVFTDDLVAGAVATSDIRDNAVTSGKVAAGGIFNSDLHDDAITGAKVLDETITSADILDDSVTMDDLADNSVSRSKLNFEPISNVVRVEGASAISNGQASGVHAFCPASSPVVLGGGYKWGPSGEAGFALWSSLPFDGGWVVWGLNTTQQSKSLTVYAICASDGSSG